MEPGVDYQLADIAVTRHSPAQGDLLKFSRCAKKYCYSLQMVANGKLPPLARPDNRFWIKSAENPAENHTKRPDCRLYGMNIHFNLLYELGAHPEIRYVCDEVSGMSMSIMGWDPTEIRYDWLEEGGDEWL